MKGIIIGNIGILIGLFFSGIIYFIQANYQVIKLSSEVYFLDYLPVSANFKEILFTLLGILSSTILFSLIPANKVKNVNPTEILREN